MGASQIHSPTFLSVLFFCKPVSELVTGRTMVCIVQNIYITGIYTTYISYISYIVMIVS